MKILIIISSLLLIFNSITFGQKKLYGNDDKPKIKGTYTELTKTDGNSPTALIGAGTIAATIGTAVLNAGIGAYKGELDKKKELASAVAISNPITLLLNNPAKFELNSYYYEKKATSTAMNFRKIEFESSFNSGEGSLTLSMTKLTPKYSQAIIKKKQNMLIYEVTINGTVHYSSKGENKTEKFNTVFLLNNPNGLAVNSNSLANKVIVPKTSSLATFSITLKEVNPYFLSPSSLSLFLENHGENVADIIAGLLIEQKND